MNHEFTSEERDLLLRGLRFVRRSVQLECADPTPEVIARRQRQLSEIDELMQQLTDGRSERSASSVSS